MRNSIRLLQFDSSTASLIEDAYVAIDLDGALPHEVSDTKIHNRILQSIIKIVSERDREKIIAYALSKTAWANSRLEPRSDLR